MATKKQNYGGQFWVEISEDGQPSRTAHIGPSGVLIGRSDQCDISMPDTTLAAQHARIVPKDGFCYLQSLKSNTAVTVNGSRTYYTCLSDGDTIELGEAQLIFHSAGGRANRQSSRDTDRQQRAFQKAKRDIEKKKARSTPPLHPLALAGIVFVVLGAWFWAFGIGAVILGTVSLFEIRSHGTHRGARLALGLICTGLLVGGMDACERAGGLDLLVSSDHIAKSCKTNLKAIGHALKEYKQDHDGQLPSSLEDLHPSYITDLSILHCPGTESYEPGEGYLYVGRMNDPPAEMVLVIDDAPRHYRGTGGFLLRSSGAVEWVGASNLKMEILHVKDRSSR